MITVEAVMLTLLLVMLAYASYTDCRTGFIYNRHLRKAGVLACMLNMLYYGLFAQEYLKTGLFNFGLLCIIGTVLYFFRIWAGGDTKLLMFIGGCIPGRIYTLLDMGDAAGCLIVGISFVVAFVWIIIRGLYLGIRNKDLLIFKRRKILYKRVVSSYFLMVGVIQGLELFVHPQLEKLFSQDRLLFLAIYILLILVMISIRERFATEKLMIAAVVVWAINGLFMVVSGQQMYVSISWRFMPVLLVLAILCLRMMLEKYNYETIPTAKVKAGDILSAATVFGFTNSRVQGLPQGVTEDLRSRITEEEAASVHRWEKSKYGKEEITLVKKIPFAVFLALGTFVFLTIEVYGR